MKKTIFKTVFFLIALIHPSFIHSSILVGLGKADITPTLGTPSAGYYDRKGEGMQGSHDPEKTLPSGYSKGTPAQSRVRDSGTAAMRQDHIGPPSERAEARAFFRPRNCQRTSTLGESGADFESIARPRGHR